MYTYRIVLDAYNSRSASAKPARVVTYSQGWNRDDAMRKLRTIYIASNGAVSDCITPWPGTRNMPKGSVTTERHLPEWDVVSVRAVKTAGTAKILSE